MSSIVRTRKRERMCRRMSGTVWKRVWKEVRERVRGGSVEGGLSVVFKSDEIAGASIVSGFCVCLRAVLDLKRVT